MSDGIRESFNTIENSAATMATTIAAIGNHKSPFGTAHQSAVSAIILAIANAINQGFRGPDKSEIVPKRGENIATINPPMAMVFAQAVCPTTGSSARRAPQ